MNAKKDLSWPYDMESPYIFLLPKASTPKCLDKDVDSI